MSIADYAKQSVWDLILNLAVSIGLSYTILNACYIDPALQYSVLPALICLIALICLFIVAYNRRTLFIGSILYGLGVIAAIVIAAVISPETSLLNDTEDNYLYFMLTMLVATTLTFLLSRTRAGTAFLFIFGAFSCALVQFFYERFELVWLVVFLLAALGLIVYKNFQVSAKTATSVRSLSFPAGFLTALTSVFLAVVLGCGIWFVIIAPLEPGALEIKLVTEYWALQTESVKGVSDIYQTPNTDLKSDDTSLGGERTVDDLWEEENGLEIPGSPLSATARNSNGSGGTFQGINADSVNEAFEFVSDQIDLTWMLWLLLLLIPLALLLYFIGRRLWRRYRLSRMCERSPSEQATAIYVFLTGRFKRIGLGIAPGLTSLEYASNTNESMRFFNEDMKVSFAGLTATYNEVAYGGREITQEEADSFAEYYKHFWKGCRKHLGNIKYFLKSFRL